VGLGEWAGRDARPGEKCGSGEGSRREGGAAAAEAAACGLS